MKKTVFTISLSAAAVFFSLLLAALIFHLSMSSHYGWPSLSFKSLFTGTYFYGIDNYYHPKPSPAHETAVPPGDNPSYPYETETNDTDDTSITDTTYETIEETKPPVEVDVSLRGIMLNEGETVQFTITVNAAGMGIDNIVAATLEPSVAYLTSSNDGLITVTALAPGDTPANIYLNGTLVVTIPIIVSPVEVTSSEPQNDNIDPNLPMIALTFDDGPSKHTSRLLDYLAEYNCHATFFIVGESIGKQENVIRRAYYEGNDIAMHSWSHAKLTTLDYNGVISEIKLVQDKLASITGVLPTLFRPPYGSTNDVVQRAAHDAGVYLIRWSVDPRDWALRDAELLYDEVMSTVKDGAIILCHDLHMETVDAMERIIPALIEKGYQLVTVSELLRYNNIDEAVGEIYYKQ